MCGCVVAQGVQLAHPAGQGLHLKLNPSKYKMVSADATAFVAEERKSGKFTSSDTAPEPVPAPLPAYGAYNADATYQHSAPQSYGYGAAAAPYMINSPFPAAIGFDELEGTQGNWLG